MKMFIHNLLGGCLMKILIFKLQSFFCFIKYKLDDLRVNIIRLILRINSFYIFFVNVLGNIK